MTASRYFGGADDLITIDGLPVLAMALAPGDYTLCWVAEWTYEPFGADPASTTTSTRACHARSSRSPVTKTTDLVNYSDDALRGTLDVLVET